jgi:membrane fusion protein, multidrug efflux system
MSLLRFLKSQWITILIIGALVAWMASGLVGERNATEVAPTPQQERPLTTVQVREMAAEKVTRFVEVQGQAEAERVTSVRAETAGRIVELPGARGAPIEAGAEIAALAMNDRQARLEEAKALVEQRKSEFSAAEQLGERGFQAQNRVKEARAELAAAEARLAAIREEIANVRIVAPFSGVLETRPVELGDYVSVGDEVATVVDNDPLRIIANVPQQKIGRIAEGASAEVEFLVGQKATGKVTLVASVAAESTRTFRIEVEVGNGDRAFRDGMSATLRIPTEVVQAHFVSPAIFSLDTQGRLGVKTVDDDSKVVFYEVAPVQAAPDGVWVAGLPETARVITVGQGFVREGETVDPVTEDDSDGAAPATSESFAPDELAATGSSG